MQMPLSFEALCNTNLDHKTLAYWIGLFALQPWPPIYKAEALQAAMSYQYDIEEQAGDTGVLFSPDAEWRNSFQPLAPVQLVKEWSPLPYAMEILGTPAWSDLADSSGLRTACLAWLPTSLTSVRKHQLTSASSLDQQRFLQLLTVGAMRGIDRNKALLIVACPGWSYEHGYRFNDRTQAYMRKAHFVVTDRHA